MAAGTPDKRKLALESEFIDRVVDIRRCAKVVKGGRRFSFSAMVVVGDEDGRVGFGLGKANEVAEAIRKAVDSGKKSMVRVPRNGTTIPHTIVGRFASSRIVMKPAPPGTGVVAGGGVRFLLELAGIRDVYAKSLGSRNPLNAIRAGMNGLERIAARTATARLRKRIKEGRDSRGAA